MKIVPVRHTHPTEADSAALLSMAAETLCKKKRLTTAVHLFGADQAVAPKEDFDF